MQPMQPVVIQPSSPTTSQVYVSAPYPNTQLMPVAQPPQRAQTVPPMSTPFQRGGEASSEEETEESEDGEYPPPDVPRQSTSYVMHKMKAESTKASFKRPQWYMLIFGNILAMMAGMVDVASIMTFRIATTHVTGNTAKMGMYIGHEMNEQIDFNQAKQLGLCVLFFCFGSFLCGLIIPKTQVHIGGKGLYGTALIAECVLLLICYFDPNHEFAPYWAAMASGLQNAMCTMHFGAVVRTTHVTGCITDIGSTAGRAAILLLRRFCHQEGSGTQLLDEAELHVDKRKLLVLVPLYVFFLTGCIVGAQCYRSIAHNTFLIPATITGFMGLVYSTLRETLKSSFKSMEQGRLVSDLDDVQDRLDRTYRTIRRIQHSQNSGSRDHLDRVDELDEQMNHVAEMMHDMETTLGEIYDQDRPHSRQRTV